MDYDEDEGVLSPLAKDTNDGWQHMLRLCARRTHFGFGALDSFLSAPDLDHRIDLVEAEAATNVWLKQELRDTLGLDQSKDWSPEQTLRLQRAAQS
jgi:hypothetical protein